MYIVSFSQVERSEVVTSSVPLWQAPPCTNQEWILIPTCGKAQTTVIGSYLVLCCI